MGEEENTREEILGFLTALSSSIEVVPFAKRILDEINTLSISAVLAHVRHGGGLSLLTQNAQEHLLILLLSRKEYQISHDVDALLVQYLGLKENVQFTCLTMAVSVLKTWEREMSKSPMMQERVQQARRVIRATDDRLVQVGEGTFKSYIASHGKPLETAHEHPLRVLRGDSHLDLGLSAAEKGEIAEAFERVQSFANTRSGPVSTTSDVGDARKRQRVDEPEHQEQYPLSVRMSAPPTAFAEALSKCAALGAQVRKVSSGRSGALSDRHLKASATDAVEVLVAVSELTSPSQQIQCMAAAGLWLAPEELLEAVTKSLVVHERLLGSALVCFLQGALLPKLRASRNVANSRLFARAVEALGKKRIDLVVHCLLARSVRPWPMSSYMTEALCHVLSLTDKDVAVVERPDAKSKPPFELALRVGRSFPNSVGEIIAGLCLCEEDSGSLRHKEVVLSQALDAALSPLSVLAASGKGKKAVFPGKTQAALPADKLDLLASDVWKPYVDTISSSSSSLSPAPPPGHYSTELLKTVSSLALLAPPGSVSTGMLSKLMLRLQTATTEISGENEPWFTVLGAALLAFVSRHHKVAASQKAREAAEKLVRSCGARLKNGAHITRVLNT